MRNKHWLRRREVYLPKGVPLGHYSPTKLHGGQVRRWRQQLVTRSIAESDAAWGATQAPSPGEEVIDSCIKRKQESFELLLLYKSGDDLLSHKCLQYHRRCWA